MTEVNPEEKFLDPISLQVVEYRNGWLMAICGYPMSISFASQLAQLAVSGSGLIGLQRFFSRPLPWEPTLSKDPMEPMEPQDEAD